MKPSDLLPLSLAACLSYDVVEVLRKKRQDLHNMQVTVSSEQQDVAPWPFLPGALRFDVGGVVDLAAARRALELAEKNCPVLATIPPRCASRLPSRSWAPCDRAGHRSCLKFARRLPFVRPLFTLNGVAPLSRGAISGVSPHHLGLEVPSCIGSAPWGRGGME
jgi:hypothetical protein